jgi:parallel beta-helix repeat protein
MAYPPQGWGGSGGGGGGPDTRGRTIVVAASNSIDPTLAPLIYRCTGVNDQVVINAAIAALGAVGGTVILLEGQYNITASINLTTGTTLRGQGPGTILKIPNGHNANLNVISASSVEHVLVADLKIDGNWSNQAAGTMNGIYFDTVTYSEIVSCWLESMRNSGIDLEGSSNIIILGNVTFDNYWNGINMVGSSYNTIVGNNSSYDDYGIDITASSNYNTIAGNDYSSDVLGIDLYASDYNSVVGNTCTGNNMEGISLYQAANNTITGNTCVGNGHAGINMEQPTTQYNTIAGNTCNGNDFGIFTVSGANANTITGNTTNSNNDAGIDLDTSDNNTVTGNICQANGFSGIYLSGCSNNTISSNTVVGNSQDTDNTYSGIYLEGGSNYNNIQVNTVRHAGGAKQHLYGIEIADNTCTGNLVIDNDLYLAGRTADYSNAGTGTIYHNNRTTAGWVP